MRNKIKIHKQMTKIMKVSKTTHTSGSRPYWIQYKRVDIDLFLKKEQM